jgi:hypothetical protein
LGRLGLGRLGLGRLGLGRLGLGRLGLGRLTKEVFRKLFSSYFVENQKLYNRRNLRYLYFEILR